MRALALSMLLLVAANPSQAALLEVDLFAPGDALVTRDTASGLDWLDLTLTTGLSVAEIEANAVGWLPAGWRRATTADVCGLLAAGGAAPTPCPGYGFVGTSGEGQILLDRLGVSIVREQDYAGGTTTMSQIWAIYDDEGGEATQHGLLELSVSLHTAGWEQTWAGVYGDLVDGVEGSLSYYGHLMVRPIPEPSTGLLLALGLCGLRRAVRHRHARP